MEAATCYVTLEPCHRGPGKTTPPCDEALVASGLKSVHIALVDPDPSFGSPDGTSCAARVRGRRLGRAGRVGVQRERGGRHARADLALQDAHE